MIIDIKYHVASLISVFLALAVGIIIGSSVSSNQTFDEIIAAQQDVITEKLDTQVKTLTEENISLQNDINTLGRSEELHQQYENMVFPLLAEGLLNYENVALVITDDSFDAEALAIALGKSGAEIMSTTVIMSALTTVNDDQLNYILKYLQLDKPADGELATEAWLSSLSTIVAEAVVTGSNQELIDYLTEQSLLTVSGSYGKALDAVVLVGGAAENGGAYIDSLDMPMLDNWLQSGLTVYGAESSNCEVSYMPSYQKKDIATVDNADTVIGQTALVLAMAGEQQGDYGIKSTSHILLPD